MMHIEQFNSERFYLRKVSGYQKHSNRLTSANWCSTAACFMALVRKYISDSLKICHGMIYNIFRKVHHMEKLKLRCSIKRFLEERNWSASDLMIYAGVKQHKCYKIINQGFVYDIEDMARIAMAFGVGLKDIIFAETENGNQQLSDSIWFGKSGAGQGDKQPTDEQQKPPDEAQVSPAPAPFFTEEKFDGPEEKTEKPEEKHKPVEEKKDA